MPEPDGVHHRIRRGIVEGHHPPGSRLIEQRLAEQLQVSRTPVREAVRRLESEGLVVSIRNRGAIVRPLDEASIADLYDVRARLEAYAAELAAQRATDAERTELGDAASAFTQLTDTESGDPEPIGARTLERTRELDAANARFHRALHLASHHDRIRQLIAAAVDAPLVFRALQSFDPEQLRRSALFHELMSDAIRAGHGDRAARLMTEHVLQGRDALLTRLADAGGVDQLFRGEG